MMNGPRDRFRTASTAACMLVWLSGQAIADAGGVRLLVDLLACEVAHEVRERPMAAAGGAGTA